MSRRLTHLICLLGASLLLAGCSYTPARIHAEPPVVIEDDRRHDPGDRRGGFCPPGQAKQGRC